MQILKTGAVCILHAWFYCVQECIWNDFPFWWCHRGPLFFSSSPSNQLAPFRSENQSVQVLAYIPLSFLRTHHIVEVKWVANDILYWLLHALLAQVRFRHLNKTSPNLWVNSCPQWPPDNLPLPKRVCHSDKTIIAEGHIHFGNLLD